jgi:1,5-anhydro-D-fructose reductase (1,5-anhydro-D-mannitol-forming)
MLKVGLLGMGDAGRHHARALAEAHTGGEITWTAVGARRPADAEARRAEMAIPETVRFVSTDELLTTGACDAVIIATPDGVHVDHALRALRAGMHVLVEKPLALEIADAEQIVSAASETGRALQVGYHLRHHAGHELVRERIAELVGRIRTVHVRWAWPDPAVNGWRAHGRDARWWSLAALGTHAIDLALWFVGSKVAQVAAVREPPTGIDRAAEVSLRFEDGTLAHVSCAVTHRAQSTFVVSGERGEIKCEDTLGARGSGTLVHRSGKDAHAIAFEPADPYARQLHAFLARCRGEPAIDRHAVTNVEILNRLSFPPTPTS